MAEGTPVTAGLDAIVVLAPPVTGQTVVSATVTDALSVRARFRLWPVRNLHGFSGARWSAAKQAGLITASLRAALHSRGRRSAYFVPDAGKGLAFNALQAVILRLGFRKVWLHHHVYSYINQRDPLMGMICRTLGPRAHHIALSDGMAKGLRDLYGVDQVHVLGNSGFAPCPADISPRKHMKTIGFLGNITLSKGIEPFLETVEQAQATNPDLRCEIAGPISDPALRARVETFCQKPNRHWLGPVHGEDKTAFLTRCDVLLFPTLYKNEALPVTIYEALAHGTPVLATPRGAIPDQLPTEWLLPEQGYAQAATPILSGWAKDGLDAASQSALEVSATHRARDLTALQRLIEEMTT
jgi:glycosyltransferase involved in cell wall biosynthesis